MSTDKTSKSNHPISVRQLKAARALLAWSQADLARHAGISEPTIARLEAEDGELGGRPTTVQKIFDALLRAGIEFASDSGDGVGVRLASAAKLGLSSAQCRGARGMLNWSQQRLANQSGLSRQIIDDFERGVRQPEQRQISLITRALVDSGIEFLSEQPGELGTGVRLAKVNVSELSYDNRQNSFQNQDILVHGNDMSSEQCRMARVALGWGVRDLAQNAGVSPDTIARLERGEQLKSSTIQAVRAAFEDAGIEFIPENGGGPGVRAPKRKA